MLQFGFRPMPHEAAACVLNGSDGRLEGIAIVHVDDLALDWRTSHREDHGISLPALSFWKD